MAIAAIYEMDQSYRQKLIEASDYSDNMLDLSGLDDLDDNLEERAFNLAQLVKSIVGDVMIIDEEIKRLRKKKQILEQNEEQVRDYIMSLLLTLDEKAIDNGLVKISLRQSAGKLIINDERSVPEEFIKVETVKTIDKSALKRWLKDHEESDSIYIQKDVSLIIS